MTFRHYDVVRATSSLDLTKRLTQKLEEGWQPFGSPVAITPYTLIQAIAAEGDVVTPVVVKSSDGKGAAINATSNPEYHFAIVLTGQSNSMAYGEGLSLPEIYDRPDPRTKQPARCGAITPDGVSYNYNDAIPAGHCLHDAQDLSKSSRPKASTAQYGCVGQGLYIARKSLPFIPMNTGILLIPCCHGGSAFSAGDEDTFNEFTGASETSTCWGADKPLYKDLLARTQAASKTNSKNILLAVVWMQGEFDLKQGAYATQPGLFDSMVEKYHSDLPGFGGRCLGNSPSSAPWICGDTIYYWKQTYPPQYDAVYGTYKTRFARKVFFVPFMTDEDG